MRLLLLVAVLCVVQASVVKRPDGLVLREDVVAAKPEKDWYETAIFYQIYPRSFRDSDGDGVGDLKGITDSLEYLQDLGVTGTWLSPIFKSPMKDFGYDIEDFYNVDPIFGTNNDLVALFAKAKQLGIKIILDFVPNHSSDKCEWFAKSENKEDGYDDWYVWQDSKGMDGEGKPIPPSNWQSVFYGSAWTWSEKRQQFYLHQFDKSQPDLNFRNERVVAEMKNVLKYWLDKGADGFRVDAINHLFEVAVPIDEPKTGYTEDPLNYGYTHHIYTKDMDETYEMIYDWRAFLDEYKALHGGETRIMMTEAYADYKLTARYYGSATRQGSHMPFNFLMIDDFSPYWSAGELKAKIDDWIMHIPLGKTSNWVLGNHDKPRVGTRYGENRIEGMLALEMGLPGVAVTYYGEEIGMVNNMDISWGDTVDPQACNNKEEDYKNLSRDPSRTPFQWDASPNAGFTTGPGTWLPVHSNFQQLNLEAQKEATHSVYKFYKELVKLRQTDALTYGSYVSRVPADNVFMYKRSYQSEHYLIVINMGGNTVQALNIDAQYEGFSGGVVVTTSSNSQRAIGSRINTKAFQLEAYEVVVMTYLPLADVTEWYDNAVFYQIYPRSFKDSDGDGVGDLKGITESLAHLKELGVDGTWLSPIFKSPMRDFGYDIADFYQVDPIFGTNEDLDALLAKGKELGLKIILDFVPNHSSNESQWFIKSENREDGYDDWYVWRDPKGFDEDGKPIPPSNWLSVFYGPAWTWSEKRQQFYLHQFDSSQPDLNFRNFDVVKEMDNVLWYWLDKGVAGFRVDAINHLFEVEQPIDEPESGATNDQLDHNHLDHIYTMNMDETYEMVYHFRDILKQAKAEKGGETRLLMTESYTSSANIMRYYENAQGTREGSQMPFNFIMINDVDVDSKAADFKRVIDEWMGIIPDGRVTNWVLGNHDRARVGTRFGEKRREGLLALEMTLPGMAVTYYGEEIGMMNNMAITWAETQDPQACNNIEENFEKMSRDPVRTPFQWNDSANAGFSSGDSTWLPVHPNHKELNLAAQKAADKSIYKFYKDLVVLRKKAAFTRGSTSIKVYQQDIMAIQRVIGGDEDVDEMQDTFVVLINMGEATKTIDVSDLIGTKRTTVALSSSTSSNGEGVVFDTNAVQMAGYDVIILQKGSAPALIVSSVLILLSILNVFAF